MAASLAQQRYQVNPPATSTAISGELKSQHQQRRWDSGITYMLVIPREAKRSCRIQKSEKKLHNS